LVCGASPKFGLLVSDGEPISFFELSQNPKMEENPVTPRIVEALRTKDSAIITFEDGKYAKYPASLLYSMLPKAAKMNGDWSNPDDGV
jgi:hypothetical protein